MSDADTVSHMSDLVCPKCESPMRSHERNGVTIDRCPGRRGILLDF